MNELIEHGYGDLKVVETREGHIEQSLFAKEHFNHYMQVADFISKSSLVPRDKANKPADIMIAMEMGLQVGIPMMQAIQDIAVINGRPCMYGDCLLGLVQGNKNYEWINEVFIMDNGIVNGASCTIKRKGHEPHTVIFTKDFAQQAGLWGRSDPWKKYPQRMLQMRARGFCIRDLFSDALRGIKPREEVEDYSYLEKSKKNNPKTIVEDLLLRTKNETQEPELTIIDNNSTPDQHCEINSLLSIIEMSAERFEKALEHYCVENIFEMTNEQANNFIRHLNKEANLLVKSENDCN